MIVQSPTREDIEYLKDQEWHPVCLCRTCLECDLLCSKCNDLEPKLEVHSAPDHVVFYRRGEIVKKIENIRYGTTELGVYLSKWAEQCHVYESQVV